jgi:hypothetical protein
MVVDDYTRKLDELERLLNDPQVELDPARIWSLLGELSGHAPGAEHTARQGRHVDE